MDRRNFIAMSPAFTAAAMTASLAVKAEGQASVEVDVSVLKLQPGDTLVLSVPKYLGEEGRAHIKALVEAKFPSVVCLVLEAGLKVEGVLRGPA